MPPSGDADEDRLEELRVDDQRAVWRLVWTYGTRRWPILATGVAASILARVFELAPAFLLGLSLDTVFFQAKPFALPGLPSAWMPASPEGQLVLLGTLIGAAYGLSAVLGWLNGWCWNNVAQHIQHEVRTDAYTAMQRSELSFFDQRQTGELMSVLNNDVNQLERFLTHSLNMGFRLVVMVGGMAAIMLVLNWQLALVPLVVVPVLGLASIRFVDRIYPKYQVVRSAVATLNSRLENNLGGIEVVKAYGQEPFEADRVQGASRDYLDAQWDAISTRIRFFPTLRLLTAAGFLATFFVGGLWVVAGPPWILTGALTAGTLVTFLLYSRRFMWPMRQLGRILNDYQYAEAASERILGLLDHEPAIRDVPDARPVDTVEGELALDDVGFAYPNAEQPALEGIDLAIEAGETLGLVGPTGSGKTTLAKLILRFYEPTEGSVRLDGQALDTIRLSDLREATSYVRQQPYLFYGTVRENIAYGRLGAGQAEIEQAARLAGAHAFVQALPRGYDTPVGERGVQLSGGQRQRIALARAIVADPVVLVLDEATSHVDNETEALIQRRLSRLTEDRTTIVIAHSLSTVRDADRIVVLEEGRIREIGTHEELLSEKGLYAQLWNVQVGVAGSDGGSDPGDDVSVQTPDRGRAL